jgi:hypothetical protein
MPSSSELLHRGHAPVCQLRSRQVATCELLGSRACCGSLREESRLRLVSQRISSAGSRTAVKASPIAGYRLSTRVADCGWVWRMALTTVKPLPPCGTCKSESNASKVSGGRHRQGAKTCVDESLRLLLVERCRPVQVTQDRSPSVESWLLPLFRHSPPEALRGEPRLARAWFNKSLA